MKKLDLCNMDEHQEFLDNLYRDMSLLSTALWKVNKMNYKGWRTRRIIKKMKKEIDAYEHSIRIENKWRMND